MQSIIKYFKKDRYAALSGIELIEAGDGKAKAKMTITDSHLNGIDSVHGGAIFTLADLAFAAASNSHGNIAVSVTSSIQFFKGISNGTLIAEAKEISFHPKIATYQVEVKNELNELIALFQGTAYRKKEMHQE